jgi:hypothetical protein
MIERFDPNHLDRVDEIRCELGRLILSLENAYSLETIFDKLDEVLFEPTERWEYSEDEGPIPIYKELSQVSWDKANKILEQFENEYLILRLSE